MPKSRTCNGYALMLISEDWGAALYSPCILIYMNQEFHLAPIIFSLTSFLEFLVFIIFLSSKILRRITICVSDLSYLELVSEERWKKYISWLRDLRPQRMKVVAHNEIIVHKERRRRRRLDQFQLWKISCELSVRHPFGGKLPQTKIYHWAQIGDKYLSPDIRFRKRKYINGIISAIILYPKLYLYLNKMNLASRVNLRSLNKLNKTVEQVS